MEFTTDYRTERFILDTQWEDLPPKVKEWAMMCGIDLMSALILGSYGKQFACGIKLAKSMGLQGDIAIVGDPQKFNLPGAAIAMGHSSNSFDIDDGSRMIQGHPGISFVGGVLAAFCRSCIRASRIGDASFVLVSAFFHGNCFAGNADRRCIFLRGKAASG